MVRSLSKIKTLLAALDRKRKKAELLNMVKSWLSEKLCMVTVKIYPETESGYIRTY